MFVNTKKIAVCAGRLATRNSVYTGEQFLGELRVLKKMHTSAVCPTYAATEPLPLPLNIDPAETTRFSPNRSRDISATVILSHYNQSLPLQAIDITTDNSLSSAADNNQYDPHVQSYDCFGAVNLNSSMQSNVPSPFGGMHKFSHLNMPGGQWSQEGKFTAQNLHNSHYTTLREQARSQWVAYDQDATIDKKAE